MSIFFPNWLTVQSDPCWSLLLYSGTTHYSYRASWGFYLKNLRVLILIVFDVMINDCYIKEIKGEKNFNGFRNFLGSLISWNRFAHPLHTSKCRFHHVRSREVISSHWRRIWVTSCICITFLAEYRPRREKKLFSVVCEPAYTSA